MPFHCTAKVLLRRSAFRSVPTQVTPTAACSGTTLAPKQRLHGVLHVPLHLPPRSPHRGTNHSKPGAQAAFFRLPKQKALPRRREL